MCNQTNPFTPLPRPPINRRDPFQADNGDGFGVGGVSFLDLDDNDNNDGMGGGGGDRASSRSRTTATMTPVSLEDRLCVDMKVSLWLWFPFVEDHAARGRRVLMFSLGVVPVDDPPVASPVFERCPPPCLLVFFFLTDWWLRGGGGLGQRFCFDVHGQPRGPALR